MAKDNDKPFTNLASGNATVGAQFGDVNIADGNAVVGFQVPGSDPGDDTE